MLSCKTQLIERSIKFEITSTEDYCGGAAPPEEMLAELKTPKPYNGIVYIHKDVNRADDGITLNVTEGKSSQVGFIEGEYFIFKDEKINPDNFHKKQEEAVKDGGVPADINCIMNNNLIMLGKFTVAADTKSISKNIHIICDPCELPKP